MRNLLILLALLPAMLFAEERILSFHSDIRVFPDGMVEVTETIRVRAEGKQIRRGIYRDFPVDYEDRFGNNYRIRLEPLSVLRNGTPEAFHSRKSGRDLRTYFGKSDVFIPHGEHTYTFRYRVNRMLGFFDEHDELYWNVTGNRWNFPIDKATADVFLEFDAPPGEMFVEAYTGRYGSANQEYSRRLDERGNVHFEANNRLPPAHGLTVVVGWSKGLVEEPSDAQRIGWILKDNANLLAAVIGLLLLLAYYIPVWMKYGRDPEEGVIVTRYEPPEGFSPASLRYIRQMYYDNKVMTAAIVNLAVKGYLTIQSEGKAHSLQKKTADAAAPAMAAGERELYEALFSEADHVELDDKNHKVIGNAHAAHSDSLKADYRKNYFKLNGLLNIPAIVIVLLTALVAFNIGDGPEGPVIVVVVAMFIIMGAFASIMRRPTLRGRKLLDEMLGFKDYLEVAEEDELNLRNPPDKTPQHFEAMLPYALALGVDQAWSERF
ncbi:MAG: DUF2207 domain-containing protein, partial [Pseudomonadota bacterium]